VRDVHTIPTRPAHPNPIGTPVSGHFERNNLRHF
jgi:hypothetical protein